jgi:hypothetical protein
MVTLVHGLDGVAFLAPTLARVYCKQRTIIMTDLSAQTNEYLEGSTRRPRICLKTCLYVVFLAYSINLRRIIRRAMIKCSGRSRIYYKIKLILLDSRI